MYGGMPPYMCPGSLVLSRIPTRHMGILMLVQVCNNSNNCLCQGRLPTPHTQIITLVKAPNNSNNSLCLPRKSLHCAGSQLFKRFLTLVQASNNSQANPDACEGS
ncbi:hypothetical protein O181_022572 [Austropuccinia psidii MF-1]|uniref:Uncharacterized protein n=1 Tax=Austropuccinia psidii MF-1 TaxID=1389203 RepID=A0A9Q3CFQ9_9BASI|nr:hypothetical protein [Austropuccinia psidii MF-1]